MLQYAKQYPAGKYERRHGVSIITFVLFCFVYDINSYNYKFIELCGKMAHAYLLCFTRYGPKFTGYL